MNTIQQISIKLRMGIDPQADISPDMLRAMWQRLLTEKVQPSGDRRMRVKIPVAREPIAIL